MSVMEERLTLSSTELKRLKVLEMIQSELVTVALRRPVGCNFKLLANAADRNMTFALASASAIPNVECARGWPRAEAGRLAE